MPDLKISQLPAASTPLAGTELVPVVQGGITEQTPVQSLLTSTVPSGTANGVMYLNGSKVATTGSGLTFNGSGFGVGTATSNRAGANTGISAEGASTSILEANVNASRAGFLYSDAASTSLGEFRNFPLVFRTNDTERMRLDSSGNVGIGTSSPTSTLDVRGNLTVSLQSSGSFAAIRGFTGSSGNLVLQSDAGSGIAWWLSAKNSGVLAIGGNGGSEPNGALNIDASGNLGLGVTPSSIGYGRMFQISQGSYGGAITAQAIDTDQYPVTLSANAVTSAANAWKYVTTASATRYEQVTGAHKWFTAPSGTAGNAISFTQAMTLDASGNLLVGATANPGVLNKSVVVNSGADSLAGLVLQNNATGSGSTDGSHITLAGTELRIANAENAPTTFFNNGSERARIDSSGNFIHQVNGTAPSLSTNSTMSFELTSNTSLKIVVRGTDGVTRSASLTLA